MTVAVEADEDEVDGYRHVHGSDDVQAEVSREAAGAEVEQALVLDAIPRRRGGSPAAGGGAQGVVIAREGVLAAVEEGEELPNRGPSLPGSVRGVHVAGRGTRQREQARRGDRDRDRATRSHRRRMPGGSAERPARAGIGPAQDEDRTRYPDSSRGAIFPELQHFLGS